MAKDPAFLFYSSDFIIGVQFLTMEDRGKYITILANMHQHGRLNEESIRLLVGSVSVMLKAKFEIDENGLWYNVKLESEIEKRKAFIDSRKENGSKGGRPKKPNGKPYAKPNGKPKKNLPENVNENTIVFEDFYKEYPLKKARFDAEKAWNKLKPEEKQAALDALPKLKQATKPEFYPYPATYLNGKRWMDDFTVKTEVPINNQDGGRLLS